ICQFVNCARKSPCLHLFNAMRAIASLTRPAVMRGIAVCLLLSLPVCSRPRADMVLTNSDPVTFAAAVQQGGIVKLAFDGTVQLRSTLQITKETTVDATDRQLTLDGGGRMRHFVVTNNAMLRLISLSLANGRHVGAAGLTNQEGSPGLGGSIAN